MAGSDRVSFDTGVSGAVQAEIAGVVGRLEALMGQRDAQVGAALSDFQADGVSEEYQHVEARWKSASGEVRGIIDLVRETLARNDETAVAAQGRARTAVANIG
jgi:hypothetical protein